MQYITIIAFLLFAFKFQPTANAMYYEASLVISLLS